jgi:hypothetical protein
MAREIINTGLQPNDGTGDTLRVSFQKTNNNFAQLFAIGPVDSNLKIENNNLFATNANGGVNILGNAAGNVSLVGGNINVTGNNAILLHSDVYLGGSLNTDGSTQLNINADVDFVNDITIGGAIRSAQSTQLQIENSIFVSGDIQALGAVQVDGAAGLKTDTIETTTPGANLAVVSYVEAQSGISVGGNIDAYSGNAITINTSLVPGADNAYSLGNASRSWSAVHVAGNSIYLGNLVIKDNGANTLGIFGPNGTTPGNIAVSPAANGILSGSTAVSIPSINGDINFVSVGNLVGKIPASGLSALELYGNLSIAGNLTVTGNTIYNNVENTAIEDPIIQLGRGANNTPLVSNDGKDRGLSLFYYSGSEKNGFFGWDTNQSQYILASDATLASDVVTVNTYGNLVLNTITANVQGNVLANVVGTDNRVIVNVNANTISAVSATVDGNITAANITANLFSTFANVTANVTAGNLTSLANLTVSGNANAAFYFGDGQYLTNVVAATGAANSVQQGTSRIDFAGVDGNINMQVGGIANVFSVATNGVTVLGSAQVLSNISANNFNSTTNVSTVGLTATTATLTGNVTAANLVATANIVASGNVTGSYIFGNGALLTGVITSVANINLGTSNVTVTTSGGNISVGVGGTSNVAVFTQQGMTANSITVNNGIINGAGNNISNIGSTTGRFNTLFAVATSAQYADLAEKYLADQDYASGIVLSFGGAAEVTQSTTRDDRRVAGVVSTEPAFRMNDALAGDHVVYLALAGRVPCKITGPVARGDMLTSNGDGTAKATADPYIGTVIGKALEDHPGPTGTIEIVVGRL